MAINKMSASKYIRSNICVICDLSFIQAEIKPEVNKSKSPVEKDV
jgi:hypothetical protein